MESGSELAGVEALATRVKQLLWVVLDSVPAELVPWSLALVRLLHAVDTFPRGGLYDGHYAIQAALRYEFLWLPLAARVQHRTRGGGSGRSGSIDEHVLVPPLDVAMAWLLHRCTAPGSYPSDCEALVGKVLDPGPNQAFRFAGSHAYSQCDLPEERQAWASRQLWDATYTTRGGGRVGAAAAGGSGGSDVGGPAGARSLTSVSLLSSPPGSEAPSPRPELGPPLRPRGGGGGARRAMRSGGGSGSSSSNIGSEAGSPGGKLAAPAATAAAAGGVGATVAYSVVESSRDGSSSNILGGGGGGGNCLQVQFWPPAARGSRGDLTGLFPLAVASGGYKDVASSSGGGGGGGGRGQVAGVLSGRMGELRPLLHSLLRPAYLDPDVLAQAVQRYCRFLMLQGMHPSVPMIPTTVCRTGDPGVSEISGLAAGSDLNLSGGVRQQSDIALIWVAHMAVPAAYRRTCHRLLGRLVLPAPGALKLDDSGPEFAETRRLYEHHFGEVYDPPLTRAVPLSTPHPLLSTPLAPFLPAFELVPTGTTPSSDLVLAATYFDADAALPSPTVQQLQQHQQKLGNGSVEYGNGGDDVGGLHRCGAHALYLLYLLRRGGNRSTRSLVGLVLGQAHRRRAAVKYVANKAAGFRNFLHLPHSDCHVYWRKLRLRSVDPESVEPSGASATALNAVDGGGGGQPDAAVDPMVMAAELYGDADSDAEAEGGPGRDGHRRRRGGSGGGDQERQHEVVRQALAEAAAAAAAAAAAEAGLPPPAAASANDGRAGSRGSRRSDDSSGGTGGGFLTPLSSSRRGSWMDASSGSAPAQRSVGSSGGSFGGGVDADPPPAPPSRLPPPPPPRLRNNFDDGADGSGALQQRPRRIALIVPLVPPPPPPPLSSSTHSTLTFAAGSSGASRRSSDHDGAAAAAAAGPSSDHLISYRQPRLPYGSARASAGQGVAQGAGGAAPAAAQLLPPQEEAVAAAAAAAAPVAAGTVDLAAGLKAAAVTANEPFQAWATPRQPPPPPPPDLHQTLQSSPSAPSPNPPLQQHEQEQGQQQPPSWQTQHGTEPTTPRSDGTAAASGDSAMPSPARRPSIERRKYEDGTDGWAYNNPYYIDRLLELGPLSPLSPLGQAPPPASAAFLVAKAAAATAGAAAGHATSTTEVPGANGGEEGAPGPALVADEAAGGVSRTPPGRGFGGEVWALRVARQDQQNAAGAETNTAETVAAAYSSPSGGGAVGEGDGLRDIHVLEDNAGGGGGGDVLQNDGGGGATGGVWAIHVTRCVHGGSEVGTGRRIGSRDSGDSGDDLYCSPSAAFAASIATPFASARPVTDDGGAGGGDGRGGGEAVSRDAAAAPMVDPTTKAPAASAAIAVAAATLVGAGGNGMSSAGAGGSASTGGIGNSAAGKGMAGPGTPTPRSGSAGSGGGAAVTPKRASGAYSPGDVSYMPGLGGVASLVTRGEESPVFSKSLRERYAGGGAAGGHAGAAVAGSYSSGGGVSAAAAGLAGDGGSSAGFSSPLCRADRRAAAGRGGSPWAGPEAAAAGGPARAAAGGFDAGFSVMTERSDEAVVMMVVSLIAECEEVRYMNDRVRYRKQLFRLLQSWRIEIKTKQLKEAATERQRKAQELHDEAAQIQERLKERQIQQLREEVRRAELEHKRAQIQLQRAQRRQAELQRREDERAERSPTHPTPVASPAGAFPLFRGFLVAAEPQLLHDLTRLWVCDKAVLGLMVTFTWP
ncbi:hypothetical protein VOLCADRAFT_105117 [Volvox carteri f. nagariensis]|uniref:Uncharacterized protein n=1 Tax=Volvox carteri f. nagariensis TaxID=3068 RepID=D8TYY4_VOLCA|nr:uncharacterized protein VOLCADRAFT_105117 [Volvox carteri f. nagariensis]EFJ47298.1 hypothetical protein VOLCADRAFT_105117 [Volvox carteri f. nagariensis]|eukprot:XP_002951487.1 hypothetical protein VOLCADRAFT_105117 [Volvox carteri f. nagariensis]